MAMIIRPHERAPQPLAVVPEGADAEVARRSAKRVLSETEPYVQITRIAGGIEVPAHSHAAPEAMVILEGGIELDGETHGPGTILIIPANEPYGFRTADREDLEFVVVRPESGGFRGGD